MSEDAELAARIAALAGRINQTKQGTNQSRPAAHQGTGYPAATNRWTPYGHQPHPYHRGGGYKPAYPSTHRNRTLVVSNSPANPTDPADSSSAPTAASNDAGWVSKRDRHMQLINTAVYNKKTQQRQQEIDETTQQKRVRRDEREKNKVLNHFQPHATAQHSTTTTTAPSAASHEIVIHNLKFRVAADGSKLIRISGMLDQESRNLKEEPVLKCAEGPSADAQPTPKEAKVAGVTFHRSKNGNLYRAGLVKQSQRIKTTKSAQLCPRFTSTGTQTSFQRQAGLQPIDQNDTRFLTSFYGRPREHRLTACTGVCTLGDRCRFTHDFNKVAICKEFLRSGECAAGEEACNLSHDPTPNRVPACVHFVRGNCTNPDCRYAHVNVSPAAPVCRVFATIGYCEKGVECLERHVYECPDYANKGVCRNPKCRMPHLDTAASRRKAAAIAAQKAASDDHEASDVSSDEEDYQQIDSDDVDSDDMDEDVVMKGSNEQSHELSQQKDFISFS